MPFSDWNSPNTLTPNDVGHRAAAASGAAADGIRRADRNAGSKAGPGAVSLKPCVSAQCEKADLVFPFRGRKARA